MRGAVRSLGMIFLLILTLSFSLIPADAHLTKDEVPRHGAAGTSIEQDNHSHPHNRIIWYQIESVNYTGSLTDRYEQILSNYTIPALVPEPPKVYGPANFEYVPFVVMFYLDHTDLICQDGRIKNDIETFSRVSGYHKELVYSYGYDFQTTEGRIVDTYSENRYDSVIILNGTIDKARGIVHLEAIIDHNFARYCSSPEKMFNADFYIACDGSSINMTSRSSAGYTITATDEESHATCFY